MAQNAFLLYKISLDHFHCEHQVITFSLIQSPFHIHLSFHKLNLIGHKHHYSTLHHYQEKDYFQNILSTEPVVDDLPDPVDLVSQGSVSPPLDGSGSQLTSTDRSPGPLRRGRQARGVNCLTKRNLHNLTNDAAFMTEE